MCIRATLIPRLAVFFVSISVVHIGNVNAETVLRVRLEANNLSGDRVSDVEAGQEIWLNAFLQDTRGGKIYSAFLDIFYDKSLLGVAEHIETGTEFDGFVAPAIGAGRIESIGGAATPMSRCCFAPASLRHAQAAWRCRYL